MYIWDNMRLDALHDWNLNSFESRAPKQNEGKGYPFAKNLGKYR